MKMVVIFGNLKRSSDLFILNGLKEMAIPCCKIDSIDLVEGTIEMRYNNSLLYHFNDIGSFQFFVENEISICYYSGNISFFNASRDSRVKIIDAFLLEDYNVIKNYCQSVLVRKKSLGRLNSNIHFSNKLINLMHAKEIGFKTPNFNVVSSISEFKNFYKKNNEDVICKTLSYPINYLGGGFHLEDPGTFIVRPNDVSELDISFLPTFLQESIKSNYELRIFYLNTKIYALKLKRKSGSLEIDIRKEILAGKTMCTAVSINGELKKNIIDFFKKIDLNVGSLDIICSTQGDFYFLELNPTGKYEWISDYCGFNLDMEIVNAIINYE